jgi:dolichol-phosphate mannosyltransferase
VILVVLPSFNEANGLRALIPRIDAAMQQSGGAYRILVLDDGSTDDTADVVTRLGASFPITLLRHPVNRGLWETIRDAFEWAAAHTTPDDVIVRMDADDTHDPFLIIEMMRVFEEDPTCEVVIASRFAPGGGMVGVSRYRQLVSRGASLVMRALFPIEGVKDYSCGYRAYRARVIHDALAVYGNAFIDLRGVGFTCTVEKLLRLRSLGACVREVPLVLRYDRKQSPSKMLSGITTLGYFVLVLKNIRPWGEHGKAWRRAIAALPRHRQASDRDA